MATEKPRVYVAQPDQAEEIARALDAFNAEFECSSLPIDELARNVERMLATGEIVVLRSGEPLEGLALLSFRRSVWAEGPAALLEELYVVPERRGQGIGRALMEAVLARVRAARCAWIELTTGESDTTARALYESLGFTNIEDSSDRPRMLYYEMSL